MNYNYRYIFPLNSNLFFGGSFLLDDYPEITHAYAMVRLGNNVTRCVRLRRSTDNAESDFSPEDIENGTAETWVGAGNIGFIRTWYNQVTDGASDNLANGTAGSQPRLIDSGNVIRINGIPVLNVPSTSNCLLNGGTAPMSEFHLGNNTSYIVSVRRSTFNTTGRQTIAATYSLFDDPGYYFALETTDNQVYSYVENNAGVQVVNNTNSVTVNLNSTYLYSDQIEPGNGTAADRSTINFNGASYSNNALSGTADTSGLSARPVQILNNINNFYFRGQVLLQAWANGSAISDRAAFEAKVSQICGL